MEELGIERICIVRLQCSCVVRISDAEGLTVVVQHSPQLDFGFNKSRFAESGKRIPQDTPITLFLG